MAVQLGATTPVFYAFRDREYVLNQIEAVTGGRFHPNFDRIGGLKDDLPKGWIAETKQRHGRRSAPSATRWRSCSSATRSSRCARRGIGVIPPEVALSYGLSGRQPPGLGRRLGPPSRHALRRSSTTSSTGRSGPTPTATPSPATGCGSRRPARPSRSSTSSSTAAVGPDHGQGAPHHQGARRARRTSPPRTRSARWATTSCRKGDLVPFRVKIRSASFNNVSIVPWLLRGVYVPDVITILASLYFILGDIDR